MGLILSRTERAVRAGAPAEVAAGGRDDQRALGVRINGFIGYGMLRRYGVILRLASNCKFQCMLQASRCLEAGWVKRF